MLFVSIALFPTVATMPHIKLSERRESLRLERKKNQHSWKKMRRGKITYAEIIKLLTSLLAAAKELNALNSIASVGRTRYFAVKTVVASRKNAEI